MNRRLLAWPVLLALALSGCKRDERGGGEPIRGKSSDPAVAFVGRWDETNAFVYHLESITGTQIPRRNTNGVIQQDTILAKDLRFGVTNVTPEGFRSMKMEIQSVRVETTADQRLTSAFDTENEMLSTEDNAVASRLRRVKGAQLGFRLSPANRVLRVDGTKEFNDRIGTSRNVKGAAGAVLNKFLNQQFYRDLIEMSFLPTNSVRIGESWTVRMRSLAGLYTSGAVDLTYTFRGWQEHENTNCARFDFTGNTRPTRSTSNNRTSSEEAEIEGTVWFSPELGVPIEMIVNQSLTRNATSTKIPRPPGGTNAGPTMVMKAPRMRGTNSPPESAPPPNVVVDVEDASEPLPPGAPGTTNVLGVPVTTSRTTTTKQHLVFTLIEIVPVDPPASSSGATK
jgi:hypothetical protein